MRWTSVGAFLVIAGLALAAEDKVRTLHFAKEDAGKLPAGWKAEKTGTGEGSGVTKRLKAGWDEAYLLQVLQAIPHL